MLLSHRLAHCIEKANLCCGALLNGLLLYIVFKHSRADFGVYRTLLFFFASYDMFLSMLHMFMNPKIINADTTFSVVSYSPIEHRYFSSIFCASFTVSFSITIIHFLYRYFTVSKSAHLKYFKDGRFIFALLLYTAADELSCYFRYTHLTTEKGTTGASEVRTKFAREFNDTVEGGWLIVDYYPDGRLSPLAFSFFASGVFKMLLSMVSASVLAGLTYAKILEARNKSFNFNAIQLAFLKTVIAQASIPTLFVYIPYFVVIFLPLMGWESAELASYFPLVTSFFPGLDALVIIIMIRRVDYREAAANLLLCRMMKKADIAPTTAWNTSTTDLPESHLDVSLHSSGITDSKQQITISKC